MYVICIIMSGKRNGITKVMYSIIGKRSEGDTIGSKGGNLRLYMLQIVVLRPHFSSVGIMLCNVGGVMCQPFLKHSNIRHRH